MTEPLTIPTNVNVPTSPGTAGARRSLTALTQQLRENSAITNPQVVQGAVDPNMRGRVQQELTDRARAVQGPPVSIGRQVRQDLDTLTTGIGQANEAAGELFNMIPGVQIAKGAGRQAVKGIEAFRDFQTLSPEEQEANAAAETELAHKTMRENQQFMLKNDVAELPEYMRAKLNNMTYEDFPEGSFEREQLLRADTKALADYQQNLMEEQGQLVEIANNEQARHEYGVYYDRAARFLRGTAMTGLSVPKALTQVVDAAEELLMGDPSRKSEGLERIRAAEQQVLSILKTDVTRDEEKLGKIFEAGGSFAASLFMGLFGRALGLSKVGTTAIAGSLPNAAQQYDEAERFDATTFQKMGAWITGSALGAAEMLPIFNALHRANINTGGYVNRLLANSAATALEEAITEVAQDIGHDLIARTIYDENRQFDPAKYWDTFTTMLVVGGGGGAVIQSAAEAGGRQMVHKRLDKQRMEQEAAMAELLFEHMERETNDRLAAAEAEASPAPKVERGDPLAEPATAQPVEPVTEGAPLAEPAEAQPVVEVEVGENLAEPAEPAPVGPVETGGSLPTPKPETVDAVAITRVPGGELEKLPGVLQNSTGPVPAAVQAAQSYARANGLPVRRQTEYVPLNADRAKRIAEAYDQMEPTPEAEASYEALAEELVDQMDYVMATGVDIELLEPGAENPYANSPTQLLEDMDSGHLWVQPLPDGAEGPMAEDSGYTIRGKQLKFGDILNIVHSFFGHGIEGAGFGPRGNENAWQAHSRLFTPEALPAFTTETRGRESWISHGPNAKQNRKNPDAARNAPRKTGLLPDWAMTEGVADSEIATLEHEEDTDLMALTSAVRDQLIGEPAEPGFVPDTPANQPIAGDEDLNLRRIAGTLIRALDLTVQQGRIMNTKAGQKLLGIWKRKAQVIRLQSADDLSVLVHEAGHAIHDTSGRILQNWIDLNETELGKLARHSYPGQIEPGDLATLQREGFAELVRLFGTNPDYLRQNFTSLAQNFEDYMQQNAPELASVLAENDRKLQAWAHLPSTQKLRNTVKPAQRPGAVQQRLNEIADQGFGTVFDEGVRHLLTTIADRYVPLKELTGRILDIAEQNGTPVDVKRADDPYTLARLAVSADAGAKVQIEQGVTPYRQLQPVTRGLRHVLAHIHGLPMKAGNVPMQDEIIHDFDAYLVALRGLDEWRRYDEGKLQRPPMNTRPAVLQQVVAELDARHGSKFGEAATMFNEYAMALWQKGFDAGLMDADTYQEGGDRQFYAPLQRDMSDKARVAAGITGDVTSGRKLGHRFRGSDRDILSPTTIMMQKTFALERNILQNDIVKSIAKLTDSVIGSGAEVERVSAHRMTQITANVKEAIGALSDDTMSPADRQDMLEILQGSDNEDASFTIFRAAQAMAGGDNLLFYWDKGKLQAVQLNDPQLGKEVVDLLTTYGHDNMDFFMGLLVPAATAVRTTITSWPDFMLANFIRDQVQTGIITNVGYIPFVSGMRGVWDELRQKDWARAYNQTYGRMGGVMTATLHEARTKQDINALRGQGYLPQLFSGGYIKGFAKLTELTETGTRLGVFKHAFQKAKKDGLTDYEAGIEASYTATDIIDFGLNGNRTVNVRRMIPFLNVQLIGWHKFWRALSGDEAGRRKGLQFALSAYFKNINGLELTETEKRQLRTGRMAWVKMVGLAMASGTLAAMLEDDEDYQAASDYLKDTNWIIPGHYFGLDEEGSRRIFTIPKPFEVAILTNVMQRGMDRYHGDEKAWSRFWRGFARTNVPPVSNPLTSTIWEQYANVDAFRGTPIDPWYQQAMIPSQRYSSYTSEISKWLGEQMNWSPNRIDHFLSGMFTSAFRDTAAITNNMNPNRPAMTWAEAPIVRRFFRKTASGSSAKRDLYDQVSAFGGVMEQKAKSYKLMLDNGQVASADETLDAATDVEKVYMILNDSNPRDAVVNEGFGAKYLRMHPMKRAKDVASVISGMKRQFGTELGLQTTDDLSIFAGQVTIPLTRRQKARLSDLLDDVVLRTSVNAMKTTGHPTWKDRQYRDVKETVAMIETEFPSAHEELMRRMETKKVYSAEAVRENWPELRDTVVSEGADALIDPLLQQIQLDPEVF